jgi:FtsH-binding integral membrane protein
MSDHPDTIHPNGAAPALAGADAAVDLGLRRYLLAVYNNVALGLAAAGALGYDTANVATVRDLLFKPAADGAGAQLTVLGCLVAFAPLIVLLLSSRALNRPTPRSSGLIYWSVVAGFGAAMGIMVLTFTGLSIATTFAIAAAAFGGLSLYGYSTRRDLNPFGAFLTVGLFGLIATLVLNLVLRSPAVEFATNLVGTFVFAGLIAYDTQRLKSAYYTLGGDAAARGVASNVGALSLFINFLNLFQFLLLMLSGQRR